MSKESTFEYLLVDIVSSHIRLDSVVSALLDNRGNKYLPIRRVSTALGFRISVIPEQLSASGFLFSPKDRLIINGQKGEAISKKKSTVFDRSSCFSRDGDLYIRAEIFAQLAGIELEWKMDRLELEVRSATPVTTNQPSLVRQYLALNLEKKKLRSGRQKSVDTPYSLWNVPKMEFQLYSIADYNRRGNSNNLSPSFEGIGDLLFMDARYRITTDINGDPRGSLTLSRNDTRSNMLGSFHASEILVGEFLMPTIPLLTRGRTALGISVGNQGRAQNTGKTQLTGRAPPGSIIEVYRDNSLIGAAETDSSGNFEVGGLRLDSGSNNISLVVIGKEGQIEERPMTLYGDLSTLSRGESRYRLSFGELGASLFGKPTNAESNLKGLETSMLFEHGLTSSTWISGSGHMIRSGGVLATGLHTWSQGVLWNLQGMSSKGLGNALQAGFMRKFRNSTFSFEQLTSSTKLEQGLIPEQGYAANSSTRIRWDGFSKGRNIISYGFALDRMVGDEVITDLRARTSAGLGEWFFSNYLAMRFSNHLTEGSGLIQAQKRFGSSFSRLELGYGWGTGNFLQLFRLTHDNRLNQNLRYHYGIENESQRSEPFSLTGGISRNIGALSVGLNLNGWTNGVRASLVFSTAIGEGSQTNSMKLVRSGSANSASIKVRTFLDKNGNSEYDKSDLLLPNVGFKVTGYSAANKTNEHGIAVLGRLTPDQEVVVSLNEETFDDPLWISAQKAIRAYPRKGRTPIIDFPVLETGEIEGRIAGMDLNLALTYGLEVRLESEEGVLVSTSALDDNQVFVFSRVIPGIYQLRLVDVAGKCYGRIQVEVKATYLLKGIAIPFSSDTAQQISTTVFEGADNSHPPACVTVRYEKSRDIRKPKIETPEPYEWIYGYRRMLDF